MTNNNDDDDEMTVEHYMNNLQVAGFPQERGESMFMWTIRVAKELRDCGGEYGNCDGQYNYCDDDYKINGEDNGCFD